MLNYEKLKKMVPAPGASADWKWLLDAIPGLTLLETTPQDPTFHAEGNVLIHTKLVVEELLGLADYANASDDDRFALFYAAVLHDIAKPATTVIDPDTGKIGQPGHSKRGAIDIRIMLWHAEVPFAIRENICRMVSVHQLPFFLVTGENRKGTKPEFVLHKLSHELNLVHLAALAEADMRGRHYEHKDDCLVDIELFRQMAIDESCYGAKKGFADDHTRVSYFRGAEISPDYPHFKETGSRVIMMSGLPASGKDTYLAMNHPSLPVVSIDGAMAELGLKYGENNGAATHHAMDFAKRMLAKHVDFAVNMTHLSPLTRKKTLDMLYAYGAEVEMIYLEQKPSVILQRNDRRDSSLPSKKIMGEMLFKWEAPTPVEAHQVTYIIGK